MQLLEIFKRINSGQMSTADAASMFQIEERLLKLRMTKWGDKLPFMLETLDQIQEGWLSREQAAERLGVTVRDVSHLVHSYQVTEPVKEYLVERERTQLKFRIRTQAAIDFIGSHCTITQAAEKAECDERTIRRWVSKLLFKHFEMTFKEHSKLPLSKQRRLAQVVADGEGLTIDVQQGIAPVVEKKIDITDLARQRVEARKQR